MNTPHTHPRATEFLYLINGTLQNGMLTETGSRFVVNNMTAGQGMLLPQVCGICSPVDQRLYVTAQQPHLIRRILEPCLPHRDVSSNNNHTAEKNVIDNMNSVWLASCHRRRDSGRDRRRRSCQSSRNGE